MDNIKIISPTVRIYKVFIYVQNIAVVFSHLSLKEPEYLEFPEDTQIKRSKPIATTVHMEPLNK